MKLLETRFLRGPNLYTHRSCLRAIIDLEELDGVSSADLPGFNQRLCQLLPSLQTHRCSVGKPGGFVQRLENGTYMAHIVEHVALELQCLAGSAAGFGRTRATPGRERCYTVVFSYQIESLALPALNDALALVEAVTRDEAVDLPGILRRLRRLVMRHGVGPSTQAILQAARKRGIPITRLSEDHNLYQLGWGVRQQRIQASMTSETSNIATRLAGDKQLTRRLLQEAGIPVPRGVVVRDATAAVREARRLRGPVVIKPADANHGKGVRTRLEQPDDIAQAFEQAREFSPRIIVEEFIEGADYRLLIVNGAMVAAARRDPPYVVGDGLASIRALVDQLNQDPARGEGHSKALTRITLDTAVIEHLQKHDLTPDSVPALGERIILRGNANLSTGGSAEDVTELIHPQTRRACERAVRQIGLDVAGVDLVCRDITRPLDGQGAIIEINAAPGLRMHESPSHGSARAVGDAIVSSLFPRGETGRIPLVAITGTNGKTTTTLLVGAVFQAAGFHTGVCTTEGIFLNGNPVRHGDCTGYWSGRTVLNSPDVEAAVLETARGGILKRGLAFQDCDVAVVLNVSADHIGLDGIESVRDLARVKQVVARRARKAVVLNADDPYCVGMTGRLHRGVEVVYFSASQSNPVMQAHLRQGGRGVYLADGIVTLQDKQGLQRFFAAADLPVTLQGHATHNTCNVLAAVAALVAEGSCSYEAIRAGIASFRSHVASNPLRLNLYQVNGISIIHDYAHNLAAYQALLQTAHSMRCQRIIGAITAPGDRRDTELEQIARLCAAQLDEVVVYEVEDRRGRAPGELAQVLHQAASRAARPGTPVHLVLETRQAALHAFQRCVPGDLLLIGGATEVDDLALILALQNQPTSPTVTC